MNWLPRLLFGSLIVMGSFSQESNAQDEPKEAPKKSDAIVKSLGEMVTSGKMFEKKEYPAVRKAFCQLFEERNKEEIEAGFGEDRVAILAFLEKNREFKEELFTAFDEKHDKIANGLKIIAAIWKKSPENLIKYSNLAIALAVVWDNPKNVYDYEYHAQRTKSTMPSDFGKLTPIALFDYWIAKEKELKGKEAFNRLTSLPWEFLIYVVDDVTPLAEHDWAIKNYITKRPGIGKIYSDIKYDVEMLKTNSKVCKLNDKPYTLESILKHGGVCAMQADYAARVGKSLMVPAAYVGGESTQLGLHAWVMWVEIRSVTKQKIDFALMDHGRYQGDLYYTGNLRDPQTGLKILDRDMERRLFAVGQDRTGKRQSELAMDVYHDVVQALELPPNRQIRYLDACLRLCDFNETAWIELAGKVKTGEIDAEFKPAVLQHIATMMKSFEKYPDFTWKVANDLLQIQENTAAKITFYEKLNLIYEKANRPDLACEARLAWANLLTEDKKHQLAAKGLNLTIQKYPTEGRYIPKLITALRDACSQFKEGEKVISLCYETLIQKIPPRRGDEPSEYAIRFYKEALSYFKDQKGKDKIVKDLERRLQQLAPGKSS
jgi:hypothetical protein